MGPNFNENFVKKSTCGSREQCTGPTELDANVAKRNFQLYPNSRYKNLNLNNWSMTWLLIFDRLEILQAWKIYKDNVI